MPSNQTISEFRAAWLPHVTDAGLDRLTELLERSSPMLIHGTFQSASAAGCLATHIAWNHPRTGHLHEEAGVIWLTRIARLNPATSSVVQEWDRGGTSDWELRSTLLELCHEERTLRASGTYRWDDAAADLPCLTV